MRTSWPQPDFLADAPRRPDVVWWWCVAVALAAALATGDWVAAKHELATQRDRLATAIQRLPVAAAKRRPAASGPSGSEPEAIRAAQHIVDRIAHPWDRILANVEAETPEGVQWLELDHDADETTVRLEGAAADVASVLQLVDNLSDRPGWSDVVLGRLRSADAHEAAPATAPWYFELRAGIDAHRIDLARPNGER